MTERKFLHVAIAGPKQNSDSDFATPTLRLPAKPIEIRDALDQAGIADPFQPQMITLLPNIYYKSFQDLLLSTPLNIMELNKLTEVLSELGEQNIMVLEGLIKAHSIECPLTLAEIINLASVSDGIPMIERIYTDEQLGKWTYENHFLPEDAIPEGIDTKYLNFAQIGKERRLAEKGVYTYWGYVPNLVEKIPTDYSTDSLTKLDTLVWHQRTLVDAYNNNLDGPIAGSWNKSCALAHRWMPKYSVSRSQPCRGRLLLPARQVRQGG